MGKGIRIGFDLGGTKMLSVLYDGILSPWHANDGVPAGMRV